MSPTRDAKYQRDGEQLRRGRAARTGPKPLVSVEEAAEMFGQSRSSLYRAIAMGSFPIPVLEIGGRYRISRAAIQRLIDGESPSTGTG